MAGTSPILLHTSFSVLGLVYLRLSLFLFAELLVYLIAYLNHLFFLYFIELYMVNIWFCHKKLPASFFSSSHFYLLQPSPLFFFHDMHISITFCLSVLILVFQILMYLRCLRFGYKKYFGCHAKKRSY